LHGLPQIGFRHNVVSTQRLKPYNGSSDSSALSAKGNAIVTSGFSRAFGARFKRRISRESWELDPFPFQQLGDAQDLKAEVN